MFLCTRRGGGEFRANNKITNVISTNVNNQHFEGHSAVMRLEVAEWFITNFTVKNDVVLDTFMGMGTTGVACVKNKRHYIGFELVHEYRDKAITRIEQENAQYSIFDYLEEQE